MAQSSAPTRALGIPEILEQILLEVITDASQRMIDLPSTHRNMVLPITLQHVNRDFYHTIGGSRKILARCLALPGRKVPRIWTRIIWLAHSCGQYMSNITHNSTIQLLLLGSAGEEPHLTVTAEASWRKLTCLPNQTLAARVEIYQPLYCTREKGEELLREEEDVAFFGNNVYGKNTYGKRLATWQIDNQHTLGMLYDDLAGLRVRQARIEDED